ncbi:MAG: DsbA family protein [Alphaproteobacteria bacterium]
MKYAQLITGLLIGTALGGSVVAATGSGDGGGSGGGLSKDDVRAIVRDEIGNDGQLLIDSLQKYQASQRDQQSAKANESLKDAAVQKALYDTPDTAFVGNRNGKKVVVEFFDYNCPACKMMFPAIEKSIAENKEFKLVFKEFPIFGPVSDHNSAIGLAIWHLYPRALLGVPHQDDARPRPRRPGAHLLGAPGHGPRQGQDRGRGEEPEIREDDRGQPRAGAEAEHPGHAGGHLKDNMVPGAMDYDQFKAALAKE